MPVSASHLSHAAVVDVRLKQKVRLAHPPALLVMRRDPHPSAGVLCLLSLRFSRRSLQASTESPQTDKNPS